MAHDLAGFLDAAYRLESVDTGSLLPSTMADSNPTTPSKSAAASLPTELIQQIYRYLGPSDFNAARHTCSHWLSSSLHIQLLAEQVKRGGWTSNVESEPQWKSTWVMVCFLARQCALAGGWTGNGLARPASEDACNPMVECCSVDFTDLGNTATEEVSTSTVCTTSSCGRYFVIAKEREMYIYELDGMWPRLTGRVVSDQKVLAVAIDTASDCFALAAILENRVGLYVDLLASPPKAVPSP
jgi:hypothetical protein